jgi:hypothetical protein
MNTGNMDFKVKYKYSDKGQTVMFAMVIIVVVAIFTPALLNLLRNEVRWSVKHKRDVTAFHLAEAAVDRGIWKLQESSDSWDEVEDGTFDTNYKGNKVFTDVEGGEYKIIVSTTADENQRKIIGIGRDTSTNELRSIEVIVEHVVIDAAVYAPTLVVSGSAEVHWGPIQSIGDMTVGGDLFPRKYAVGEIHGRTPDGVGDPDTDDTEYWAHYPVPTPPGINFQYYFDNADEYYGPEAHPNKIGGVPADFNNHAQDAHGGADRIYYVDGNLSSLRNTYLKGALIVTGTLELQGGGKGGYTTNDVPLDAWEEYAAMDTPAAGDYYADTGDGVNSSTFTFDGATIKISVEGFVYIGGDWTGTGNQDFHGCVQCMGSMAGLTGNVRIFYNEQIAKEVEITDPNITQISWREIKPAW